MASKYEDLLKLAEFQQERGAVPNLPPQNPLQGLLQTLASVAVQTGSPNTERGQIFQGAGQAYLGGLNQRNKQLFFSQVGQISRAPIDPAQKIDLLISLKAQHGQDYGLGLDDIMKQYGEMQKTGPREWKPGSFEEAIQLEEAKYGVKRAHPTALEQKAQLDLEDRQKQIQFAKQDLLETTQDTLDTIQEVENGIEFFGLLGSVPSIPGTSRAKWEANLNKLLSGKVIGVMTAMKQASRTGATGFGQLSNKELQVLREASTALKKGLAPKDAQQILREMKSKLEKIVQGSDPRLGVQTPATTPVASVSREDAIAEARRRGLI